MRSFISTFVLILATAILGILSFLQFREGNLDRLLGTPPVTPGELIFPDFDPNSAATIEFRADTARAVFVKAKDGWHATSPWTDRMDPRAALAVLTFINTTRAEDSVPRDKLDPHRSSLDRGIQTTVRDGSGEVIARFRLGRGTPLENLSPGGDDQTPVPTTYLLPLERGRKSHVYAATGNILPLLKEDFRYLRDHHPFYFNPLALEKIRIRIAQGELTLARATPASPWRITKPLDLPTNPTAVKTLLEGLVNLQALKLGDRSDVTLPSDPSASLNDQIAVSAFSASSGTVLDLYPPDTPSARETQATVSDRPSTLFTLPVKSSPDLVSLSDLPLSVNDLRDPTLTNLNIASIRGLAIKSATSPTILISREPPAPWLATINGHEQPANEQRLYELLKAVTDTRAIAFETDAASQDLSPWGLDKPILTLIFLAAESKTLTLHFGLDRNGDLFAKRKDSPTVMRIAKSFLDLIATSPHEWRHARLWDISRADLTGFSRSMAGGPALDLQYDFYNESWQAASEGTDATADLDPAKANFLLGILENLQVSRWLSPSDEAAALALANPTSSFTLRENVIDDLGENTGTRTLRLDIAADPSGRTIYGKRSDDPVPFTLDPESFLKLSIPLLDP